MIGTDDLRTNAGNAGVTEGVRVARGPARMAHVSAQGNLRIMECQIVECFLLLTNRANMKTEKYTITTGKKSTRGARDIG